MNPSQNQALAGCINMEEEIWSSVSGLENEPARGRVQPGSGLGANAQGWGPRGLTTLVFIQGCGADDVNYVLSSGHLCPPGHLHWLLGRDSFVSFIQPSLESTGWGVGQGTGGWERGMGPMRGCEGLYCKGDFGLNANLLWV